MTFERQGVRELAAAKEARDPGAVLSGGVGAAAIGQTLVPSNMPPEKFGDQSDYARAQARPAHACGLCVPRNGVCIFLLIAVVSTAAVQQSATILRDSSYKTVSRQMALLCSAT